MCIPCAHRLAQRLDRIRDRGRRRRSRPRLGRRDLPSDAVALAVILRHPSSSSNGTIDKICTLLFSKTPRNPPGTQQRAVRASEGEATDASGPAAHHVRLRSAAAEFSLVLCRRHKQQGVARSEWTVHQSQQRRVRGGGRRWWELVAAGIALPIWSEVSQLHACTGQSFHLHLPAQPRPNSILHTLQMNEMLSVTVAT
jgi:hypothetical protein